MLCSAEALALYAGGDLPPAEASEVEVHLETCEACQGLIDGLIMDTNRLQRLDPGIEMPAGLPVRRRAPLRWVPAAAVALIILSLVAVPAVQAMGRIFELFPSLRVTEMAPAELKERIGNPQGKIVNMKPVPTVEEAETIVGFHLARFGLLPDGFALHEVLVDDRVGSISRSATQIFFHPQLNAILALEQSHLQKKTLLTSDGSTREVEVGGEKAAIVTTRFPKDGNVSMGTLSILSRSVRTLFFQWKGQAMSLTLTAAPNHESLLSDEELIRLAESIR